MWGIHRWPVNSPHKWPVTRKMFPFDDVIMGCFPSKRASNAEIVSKPWRHHGALTINPPCRVSATAIFSRFSSPANPKRWTQMLLHTVSPIKYLQYVHGIVVICFHYDDVTMSLMASQITSLTVVYSTVYSDAGQRKDQSSASLAFVWGIHRDRWIPRTKGQLRGVCFHLMTSSCVITHLGRNKVAAIFQTTFINAFFFNENACILIKISLKLVPIGPIENKSALVEAMAWRRTGDKPLSEPMMVQFPYAYMRYSASMSQLTLYRWLSARLQYLQWVSSLALSHQCYVSYCGLFLNFEIVIDLNQLLYTLI